MMHGCNPFNILLHTGANAGGLATANATVLPTHTTVQDASFDPALSQRPPAATSTALGQV